MKAREAGSTYAETSCGSFPTLRKRMAFAAASSRLVAAAEPLGSFDWLPNRLDAALRLCAPPRAAGAADELVPCWSDTGWWRGMTSPASSSGQSSRPAPSPEPPA